MLWMRQNLQIYNILISLDQSQNYVSAQHLTNTRMEFNKILHKLGLDCFVSIYANLKQSYSP